MKKKIYLFLIIFICIFTIVFIYNSKDNKLNGKLVKEERLSIMIKEEGAEEYTKSSSKEIPKGDYILNKEKSHCENNGKVTSYDNVNGKISFSFIGSDRCTLYFDEVETEPPVISNLTISGNTVTATLSDNDSLAGYELSTSNTVEPSSYTSISGKTYNLSLTISSEGAYYIWVKDKNGNIKISNAISLVTIGWKRILLFNGGETAIKSKGTPDFTTSATTNEGMYAMEDDLGLSYYFRGAVDNNWVKFGKDSSGNDIYWRIIRINGDGSLRMIYTGTSAPTESTKVVMTGTGTQIGISAFNNSYNSSEYVGYMYTVGEQHGLSTDSIIKTTIDNWYKLTTLETDTTLKSLIADGIFCNDRNATTGTWSSTDNVFGYAPYTRIFLDKLPSLKCTMTNDKFTVNSSNGNGALTYPVGLITADEIMFAGGHDASNASYYLYTNQYYWSISPKIWYMSCVSSFMMRSNGGCDTYYNLNEGIGVRPVISLSKDAKLSGDGTYNNVYTVS